MARRFPRDVPVSELIERFGGAVRGAGGQRVIRGLGSLASASPEDLSFLSAARHRAQAGATRAGAVVVSEALADALPATAVAIVVADPYAHFARVARWLVELSGAPDPSGVHATAIVGAGAALARGVAVGAHAVIEDGARIGAGARIGPNCFVGRGARVGEATVLHAGVDVYHECEIGARCEIHSGTVVGSDGFGFALAEGRWEKIPQLGRVVIGDDVEIGSNCSIDRGALDDTVIEDGCKLDNLIQVGHNVRIGAHSALAGCVGIAGSAVIGRRCMVGGGAGILGHLEICDDVVISAMSLVTRSIGEPGFYSGVFPLMPNADWEKAAASLKRLASLRERFRRLERERSQAPRTAPNQQ